MRRAVFALLACTLALPAAIPSACAAPGPAEPAETETGKLDWTIDADAKRLAKGEVQLALARRTGRGTRLRSNIRPIAGLIGLTAAQLGSESGNPVSFVLDREPGAFVCEGVARRRRATGECVFHANAGFASELADRGFGLPSESQHFSLAFYDVGRSFIDELGRQGYARPTLAELVRAGEHGATLDYLKGIGRHGYRVGNLAALIDMRDHGVTPAYLGELEALGYAGLLAEDLVRLRSHGVTADFIRRVNASGGGRRSAAELVSLRAGGRAEK